MNELNSDKTLLSFSRPSFLSSIFLFTLPFFCQLSHERVASTITGMYVSDECNTSSTTPFLQTNSITMNMKKFHLPSTVLRTRSSSAPPQYYDTVVRIGCGAKDPRQELARTTSTTTVSTSTMGCENLGDIKFLASSTSTEAPQLRFRFVTEVDKLLNLLHISRLV